MEDAAGSAMKILLCHDATHPLPNFPRENDHSFLHTEAFTLSSELKEDDVSRSENTSSVLSAVVIFNIALAYHKQAKVFGRQVCFAKAAKMYETVGRLLQSYSGNYDGTALRVKLAALNNLSLIQHEQSNFESSRKGFQLLAWTIDSASTSSTLSSSQMDVQGMLLNVLFAYAPTTIAAPAA
jgi:hypothetical protein